MLSWLMPLVHIGSILERYYENQCYVNITRHLATEVARPSAL